MFAVKIKAYAKLNLTLDVAAGKNGYHDLDSFVASVDLYDLVTAKKRKDKLVSVVMHGMNGESIPMEKNNAFRAGEAFVRRFGTDGADITVYKNIPVGAGLGGSSADAAGALLAMAKLYKIDDRAALGEEAARLGSDTKYMLTGGFCRMQGRGEQLEFLPASGKKLYFLLLCPRSPVSTAECFHEFDRLAENGFSTASATENANKTALGEMGGTVSATENCIGAFLRGDTEGVGRYLFNALYRPAICLNGEVEQAMSDALSFSPTGATMTGSGSCVAALFPTLELCEWAKSRYKGGARAYTAATVLPANTGYKKFLRSPYWLDEEEKREADYKDD